MGLETTTTIEGLNSSWPLSSDSRIQGDDHVRQIKDVLKRTFPGTGGNGFNTAISATETEINYLDGVTGPIQDQLNAKAPLASPTFTGTPTTVTPSTGNNSQQIPNTSWVNAAIAANAPALRMAAKAWLLADAAGNILGSYGVASVVDTGTGIITVNFTTPFINTNSMIAIPGVTTSSGKQVRVVLVSSSQLRIHCEYFTGLIYSHADPDYYTLAVFGDQ